jgi:hypothetical protein
MPGGLGDLVEVTAGDIADGWRTLTEAQQATATTLIKRATALLPSQSPGLLDRIEGGTVPAELVQQVIIQAVRRAMGPAIDNPDGATQVQHGIDDYSESKSFPAASEDDGALYFTDRELAQLAPAKSRRGQAFAINQTPTVARRGRGNPWGPGW